MSSSNYPPQEIIAHSLVGKKNYEQIILWMLYNNDECEWAVFLQDPLKIPMSTLSRHLNNLQSEGYVNKIAKGRYIITPEGRRRFHNLSAAKEKKRKLSYPPNIILKKRNYTHWILWMVYNNNFCKWIDFLNEPLSINQSSLSKAMNQLIKREMISKDEDKKEYRISHRGKSEYSRMLQYYDLDRQTLLDEESKRIDDNTQKTIDFLEKYSIDDEGIQFRFLNNLLKLDYNTVKPMLKNEEDFHKILLYLSINHPEQYPEAISLKDFASNYGIKENTLSYYIDQIVDNNIYPVKFFKITVYPETHYYIQENEKLEKFMRAITEDNIIRNTYLNKLFSRSSEIKFTLNSILDEICGFLFNDSLRDALQGFLPDYVKYLAYKIESEIDLSETYDKLEGIIWQEMSNIFQMKSNKNLDEKFTEELQQIENNLLMDHMNFDLYMSKIRFLIYFGRIDDVLEILDDMLENFPQRERELKLKKASVFKRVKLPEKGLNLILELIQDYPKDSELLILKAYYLQYLNRKEESLNLISDIVQNYPKNGMYLDTYGEILMYFENYQDAANQFQKALELTEDDWYIPQTYVKLGICHKELGNFEKATEQLNKGKELTKKSSIEDEIKQKWFKIADLFLAEIELQ
jgi:Mn-dependent DtxR family transcriptional regulator